MQNKKVLIEIGVSAPDVVKNIRAITMANKQLQIEMNNIKLANGDTSQSYIKLHAAVDAGTKKYAEYTRQLKALFAANGADTDQLNQWLNEYQLALGDATDNKQATNASALSNLENMLTNINTGMDKTKDTLSALVDDAIDGLNLTDELSEDLLVKYRDTVKATINDAFSSLFATEADSTIKGNLEKALAEHGAGSVSLFVNDVLQSLRNVVQQHLNTNSSSAEMGTPPVDEPWTPYSVTPYIKQGEMDKENTILDLGLKTKKQLWDDYWTYVKDGYEGSYNEWLGTLNKQVETEAKAFVARQQIVADFAENMGKVFAGALTAAGFDAEKYAKGLTDLILDLLQRVMIASIAQATGLSMSSPESVLTLGTAGAAKAIVLTGLIKGAFAVAKAALGKAISGKFAQGGIVQGPSHSQGGVRYFSPSSNVELEGGEAVINKRSTRMYAPLLSAINMAGGGIKFATGGIVPALPGSYTAQPGMQNINIDYKALAKALAQIPAPVVTVQDINAAQTRVSRIVNRATL